MCSKSRVHLQNTDHILSVFVMNFFPTSPVDLTPVSFNWNILIVNTPHLVCNTRTDASQFGAVVLLAGGYFAIEGRKSYVGPVAYVRKDL